MSLPENRLLVLKVFFCFLFFVFCFLFFVFCFLFFVFCFCLCFVFVFFNLFISFSLHLPFSPRPFSLSLPFLFSLFFLFLSPLLSLSPLSFLQIALKGADISHTTKAQHLHLAWTDRVSEEFFCQGDEEKKAGLPISPGFFPFFFSFFFLFFFFFFLFFFFLICGETGMNREEVNLCKSQMGFLNFLGLPLYQVFSSFFFLFLFSFSSLFKTK